MAWRQPKDVAKNGARRGNEVMVEIVKDGLRIEVRSRLRQIVGSFREFDRLALLPVADGPDCESIDGKKYRPVREPNANSEVALYGLRGIRPKT